MSEIKPWQIVLIVVALGVLAFSGYRMMGSGVVKGPSGQMTVDVLTGQLYMLKKGKARGIMYPAKNPDTGDRTLFPVVQEDGSDEWTINSRMLEAITEEMYDESDALGSRGRIQTLDAEPIEVIIKK